MSTEPLEHFEIVDGRAFFRPIGIITLEQGITLVERAIELARDRGGSELLVSLKGVSGFVAPSLSERFALAERWARAAGMAVRLALVTPAELLDPERFAVVVMANRGLTATAVESEAEALAWFGSLRG